MGRERFLLATCRCAASARDVFAWHARPGALERLTPPWERLRVLGGSHELKDGGVVTLEGRLGPLRTRWVARNQAVREGESFEDVQLEGPFALWHHRHELRPEREGCTLEDRIRYRLPLGPLGALAHPWVRRRLERTFAYRHATLARDLRRHAAWRGQAAMKIAITGSTGLIGSALVPFLTTGGHSVARLVRRPTRAAGEIVWGPARGTLDPAALEGLDAVVHLAGESIAGGRWTPAQKHAIRESRVQGTGLLASALAKLQRKPAVLVCASAIGYYGDRGAELLDESSARGALFLSEVCEAWERAADPARAAGIRVVHLRQGVVLSPAGGALAKMLPPFQLGLGGKVGSGEQFLSWIAIDDVLAAFHHALASEKLSGPVNVVAPNAVAQATFARTLGRVLSRPTVFPMPAFAARLAFGEMADELLLASTRVAPRALESSGFTFDWPDLEGALRHVLGRAS